MRRLLRGVSRWRVSRTVGVARHESAKGVVCAKFTTPIEDSGRATPRLFYAGRFSSAALAR